MLGTSNKAVGRQKRKRQQRQQSSNTACEQGSKARQRGFMSRPLLPRTVALSLLAGDIRAAAVCCVVVATDAAQTHRPAAGFWTACLLKSHRLWSARLLSGGQHSMTGPCLLAAQPDQLLVLWECLLVGPVARGGEQHHMCRTACQAGALHSCCCTTDTQAAAGLLPPSLSTIPWSDCGRGVLVRGRGMHMHKKAGSTAGRTLSVTLTLPAKCNRLAMDR